jgi:hypothetical protein
LFFRPIISTFKPLKKSTLKTVPQINISESFPGKPYGFTAGFGIFGILVEKGKMKKSIITSGY